MTMLETRSLQTAPQRTFKDLEIKPLAIRRIPFEIRREKFVLELILNIGNEQQIEGYGSDVVWILSDIFLSHFQETEHLAPDRSELAESHLFSSCIKFSDLVAVVKKDERALAFGSYDFYLRENIIFSKATFADHSLERRYGIGNLLNILASVISAEYLWAINPSTPYSLLGRTQHPLQVAFTGRHSDRILCSTSKNLEARDQETFRRFANLCYPFDKYDERTGVACGVYQGAGAPPPAPEVNGFFEKEFACLSKEDALYFIAEWESRSSTTFRKSANLLNKIFGPEVLFMGLFLSTAVNLE